MDVENGENEAPWPSPVKPETEPPLNMFDQQENFPTLIQYDDSRYFEPPPYQFAGYADGHSLNQFVVPVDGGGAATDFDTWTPPENESQ